MIKEEFEVLDIEEAKKKPVQFACIHVVALNRLGISEEDIEFFIRGVEEE